VKFYYLAVGLACSVAVFWVANTGPAEPWWVAFLLGYACGTPIGTAISLAISDWAGQR